MSLKSIYKQEPTSIAQLDAAVKGSSTVPEAVRAICNTCDVISIDARLKLSAGKFVGYKFVLTLAGHPGHIVLPGFGETTDPLPFAG